MPRPVAPSASANLAVILENRARAGGWAGRPAFHDGPGRVWTHAEVHSGGHRAARFLSEAGVRPGDRVMLSAADRVELVWALLGAARLGALAILVNPRLPAIDHQVMVDDAAPTLVVSDAHLAERFQAAAPTVTMGELSDLAPCAFPATKVAPASPAYAQYTSGTTGTPKAAVHRHSDPACYHAAMSAPVLGLQPDDVLLSVSKAYFAYGLGNTIIFPLFSGCSAVLDPLKPTTGQVGALVERHAVTILFAVPSFYAGLVSEGDRSRFGSVRLAISAGETLQPALYHRVGSWLGREILDGLGSTEVGQTFISNTPGCSRPASIGMALPGYQVSIRDEQGAPLPSGKPGALWVKGDSVTLGYLNRPDETAKVIVGGWCRTGDRVSIDDDGYYHHYGRLDDLEIVGGNNVWPLEVEAVLLEHQAVVEVAVVAVADPNGAYRLRCFAALAPGTRWSASLEAEILDVARSRLAPYKVPRSITEVDSLPRTPTGKLRRHVLRAGWPPGG
ncbi:MAG: AMP-binding protein [Actinomycetota bacterium]|nr:AMP-binding protein [Actinomycetota bacterium]